MMLGLIVFFYEAGFLAVGLGIVLDWLVSLAFHYDTAKYWLSHWMRVVAGLVMVICANVFVYYLGSRIPKSGYTTLAGLGFVLGVLCSLFLAIGFSAERDSKN